MKIGVVGASARAAVHSLARAGYRAWAVDQFADRDLRLVAECAACPADGYPGALPDLADRFPPGPVLYTGGLENYPHVVAELASQRELWGNPPDVLERVRDPFTLFPALAACGVAVPRIVPPGAPCPSDGQWLRKPLRSGGGLGIRFARPGETPSPQHYFQEFIDGTPMSAIYSRETLLGVTEQLSGERWLHVSPFAYGGNVGPAELPAPAHEAFVHLGRELVARFELRGLWGIDFLLRGRVPYPIELNPRYTAAIEVLEHASGVAAFRGSRPLTPSLQGERPAHANVGKAIYYAPRAITVPMSGPWDDDLTGSFDPWRVPGFADIPEAGAVIEAGHPVLTFCAIGTTPAEVRERLQSRAVALDELLLGAGR